jgi:type IV pilus assembly protein PilV
MDQLMTTPKRRARRSGSREGFTLIEVLLALVILAVGLLSMAAMQLHAMHFGQSGRHSTQAALIARNQMEQLQVMPWAGIAPTGGWTPDQQSDTVVQGPDGNETEQSYALRWRITDLVVGETRALDVQVQWNEPDRPNRLHTISSVRSNVGS